MSQIVWIFVWLVTIYLAGQLAYARGRKDKWEELTRDYICIHKSIPTARVRVREKILEEVKKHKKTLDNRSKKRYNKKSYRHP